MRYLNQHNVLLDIDRYPDRSERSFVGPEGLEGYDAPLTEVAESGIEAPGWSCKHEIGKLEGPARSDACNDPSDSRIGDACEADGLPNGKPLTLKGSLKPHRRNRKAGPRLLQTLKVLEGYLLDARLRRCRAKTSNLTAGSWKNESEHTMGFARVAIIEAVGVACPTLGNGQASAIVPALACAAFISSN